MMHKLDIPRNHTTNLLSQGQPMSIVLSGPFAASIHRWTILTAEEDSRNQESNSPQTSDFLPEVTTAYLGLACNIIQEKNKFCETHCLHHLQLFELQSHDSSIFKPFSNLWGPKGQGALLRETTNQPTSHPPTNQPTNPPTNNPNRCLEVTLRFWRQNHSAQPTTVSMGSDLFHVIGDSPGCGDQHRAMGSFVEDTVVSNKCCLNRKHKNIIHLYFVHLV